ncbi:hypothetical protein AAEP93_006821 [Penicillium crustosum]
MRAISGFQALSCIFLALAQLSRASTSQQSVPIIVPKPPNIDAISFLSSRSQDQDSIFNEAIKILDSMKSSPSCNRLAATKLVSSCQTFSDGRDGVQTDSPEMLDHIRSVYAARLALCEIDGAGTPMPPSCLPVTVSPPPQKNRFVFVGRHRGSDPVSGEVPKGLLEQCLRTLESRPQWWTSYSNSRQNALVICHASRMETEKEELIGLHRSIAKSSLKLNIGLQEALQNATAQSAQQYSFIQAVQSLQEKIVTDMEVTDAVFKRTFANFLREIEAGIWSLQDSISAALSNVRTGTGVLEKDIRNVSAQVEALQKALWSAHQDAMTRSQETLLAQESNAVVQRDLASSLHLSLESVLDSDMARVYRGMQRFDAAMEWLTSRMNMILEQETRMTERLKNMETFIQQSESKASELQKAQFQQSEALSAQSRAQEAIQFDAQVSQALLAKTRVAAANLQSVIDDAAFKFKNVSGFGIGGSSAWSLCAVLLVVIAAQNLKIAISLFFLILAPDALNQVKKGFKRFFSLRKKAAKKTTEQQAEPAPAATAAPVAAAAAAASETPAAKPTAPAATPDSAPDAAKVPEAKDASTTEPAASSEMTATAGPVETHYESEAAAAAPAPEPAVQAEAPVAKAEEAATKTEAPATAPEPAVQPEAPVAKPEEAAAAPEPAVKPEEPVTKTEAPATEEPAAKVEESAAQPEAAAAAPAEAAAKTDAPAK